MAIYKVQAPDGKIIQVEGPEGASQQQVILAAQQLYTPKEQGGYIDAVRRGVAKGVGTDALRLAERATGGTLLSDIAEGLEGDAEIPDEFSYKLAEGAGNLAGLVGLTVATGGVGLVPRGAILLSSVSGSGAERQLQDLEATTPDATTRQKVLAGAGGAAIGASELLLPAAAGKVLRGTASKGLAKKLSEQGRAARAATGAVAEGGQEVAADVASNLLAREVYDEGRELVTGSTGESGAIGGILGGVLGAALPGKRGAPDAAPRTPTVPPEEIDRIQELVDYTVDPETQEIITPDGSRFGSFEDLSKAVSNFTDEDFSRLNSGALQLTTQEPPERSPEQQKVDQVLSIVSDNKKRRAFLSNARGVAETSLIKQTKEYDKISREIDKLNRLEQTGATILDPEIASHKKRLQSALNSKYEEIRGTLANIASQQSRGTSLVPVNEAQTNRAVNVGRGIVEDQQQSPIPLRTEVSPSEGGTTLGVDEELIPPSTRRQVPETLVDTQESLEVEQEQDLSRISSIFEDVEGSREFEGVPESEVISDPFEGAPQDGNLREQISQGPLREGRGMERAAAGPRSLKALFAAGPEGIKRMVQTPFYNDPAAQNVPKAVYEKVESGLRGKSAVEAADWLFNNSPRKQDKPVAEKVREKIKALEKEGYSFSFNIAKVGDEVPSLLGSGKGLTIVKPDKSVEVWVNDSSVTGLTGTTYETVLHELVHAATLNTINKGRGDWSQEKETTEAKLAEELTQLFSDVNSAVRNMEPNSPTIRAIQEGGWNTIQDPEELVSWGLTNRQFQDILNSIPYKGETVWTKFVDLVRRALGMAPRQNTALSELLRISDQLLDPKTATEFEVENGVSTISPQQMKQSYEDPFIPQKKDSALYNTYKLLFEGVADRFRRNPLTKKLGDAILNRYDQEDVNIGMFNGAFGTELFGEFGLMSRAEREAINKEVSSVAQIYDRGSKEEFDRAYGAMTPQGRKYFDASVRAFNVAGEKTSSIGVKTKNGITGKYQDFKQVQNFWPRYLSLEIKQALADPYSHPKMMNYIISKIREQNPKMTTDEAANRYLTNYITLLNQPEFFGSIEASRTYPLPAEFYDYSLNTVMAYRNQWARRASQIEYYGQGRAGNEDIFTEMARSPAIPSNVKDKIDEVRLHEYNLTKNEGFAKTTNLFNVIATGLQLGNSVTAVRNILGGTALSIDVFGVNNWAKAIKKISPETKQQEKDFNTKIGVLKDDILNIQNDIESEGLIGEKDAILEATRKAKNVTAALMTYDFLPKSLKSLKVFSFHGTEMVNRLTAAVAARMQLADIIQRNVLEKNTREGRLLRKTLENEGINIDKLTAEASLDVDLTDSGQIDPEKMPETVKFIRRMVGRAQGTYRLDNTPLWVNTWWGRSAFKYWKFSTQVMRNVDQKIIDPLLEGWKAKDYEMMGDAMKEALRYVVLFSLAGLADDAVRKAVAQYESNIPQFPEVAKKFENEGAVEAFAKLFEISMASMLSMGAFGVFGNIYEAGSKGINTGTLEGAAQQIVSFPGLAPITSIFDIVRQGVQQKTLTADDINIFFEKNVSLYRTTARAAKAINAAAGTPVNLPQVEENLTFQAMDINFMSNVQLQEQKKREAQSLIRRYGKEVEEANVRPMNPSQAPDYTERSPYNKAIYRSLLVGEPERANILFNQLLKTAKTKEERKKIINSVQSSIRVRAPLSIPGNSSYEATRQFLDWAQKNTSQSNYDRYSEMDKQYFESAYKAGILPRRNRFREEAEARRKAFRENRPATTREVKMNR